MPGTVGAFADSFGPQILAGWAGMDTAERLLRLLGLLQRRLDWSADELAERLEVTTRTVRRDVTRLRSYGYPIEAFAGHGGGYQLGAGATLPPLVFDPDEAVAVALGLRLTAYAGVDGIDDAALSALAKIEKLLPSGSRQRLEDFGSVTVTHFATDARTDRHNFTLLTRAAATRHIVECDYVDQHGVASKRRLEPLRSVFVNHRWYVAAWDLDRDDWRTFRLDRVSHPQLTSQRFRQRPGPDPIELVRRFAPPEAFAYQATILAGCEAATAREHIPDSMAAIRPRGDSCMLLIGTDDLDWLARYLLAVPFAFEVITPDDLRNRVRRLTRTIASRHTSQSGRQPLNG
jgi:predicted DNA-binding transcriptional regulator YafY